VLKYCVATGSDTHAYGYEYQQVWVWVPVGRVGIEPTWVDSMGHTVWVVLWLHVVSLCYMLSSHHGCVPYCCVPCHCGCVLLCHGCTISCPCTIVAPWIIPCKLCCESSLHYGCMLCCCVLCHCMAWVILMPWLCHKLSLYCGCTVSHCTVSYTMSYSHTVVACHIVVCHIIAHHVIVCISKVSFDLKYLEKGFICL